MSRKKLINRYKQSINDLKSRYKAIGVSEREFENIFNESINCVKINLNKNHERSSSCRYLTPLCFLFLSFLLLYSINLLFDEKPLSLFLCKIQEFIYPGLRLLRILSIPIISAFPSLTELYDETCLIQNPFFQIVDMDCWPCYSVNHISELTTANFEPHSSPPFTYKVHQREIGLEDLQNVYKNNKPIFDKDSPRMLSNNLESVMISDYFLKDFTIENVSKKRHLSWRLNRMFPAQIMRSLFPRPDVIPRLGHSTEKFIIIDEPGAGAYPLPDPECNFVFIIQSLGERLVQMQPAKECTGQCKTVPVLLPPSTLLWYNWWYWRPVTHPTNSNTTSISYMGSYC